MPEIVRFGIFLPQIYPWPYIKQEASKIEASGFDSLWIADHFVSPYSATVDWFECWSLLGALAASTERIRLGTGVTHVVYRNPAILARSAMTIDHISNGRLDFGMGVGSSADYNYSMTGTPEQNSRVTCQRGEMLAEFALQAGRDPGKIRRTFFAGYSSDHPFVSVDAFQDFIGRYRQAGIDEFVLGYAPGIEELKGDWMITPDEFERYAEVIGEL